MSPSDLETKRKIITKNLRKKKKKTIKFIKYNTIIKRQKKHVKNQEQQRQLERRAKIVRRV